MGERPIESGWIGWTLILGVMFIAPGIWGLVTDAKFFGAVEIVVGVILGINLIRALVRGSTTKFERNMTGGFTALYIGVLVLAYVLSTWGSEGCVQEFTPFGPCIGD